MAGVGEKLLGELKLELYKKGKPLAVPVCAHASSRSQNE